MMMPSIFGENLFDDFMDFPLKENFSEEKILCMERTKKTL